MYTNIKELVDDAKKKQQSISELMIQQEINENQATREEVWQAMEQNLAVMENAAKKGVTGDGVFSKTGLTGGEAVLLQKYRQEKTTCQVIL
jgi:L-serine dehydratase